MDERTSKILARKKATAARREEQDLRVLETKINQKSLSKKQLKKLDRMFLEAKWLINTIIANDIFKYNYTRDGVFVKLVDGSVHKRSINHLPAHVKQTLQKGLQANVKALATAKKAGKKVGKIGFVKRVSSLEFPTGDLKFKGNAVKIPLLGWVTTHGSQRLDEIANARLIRRTSGYYLMVSSCSPKSERKLPKLEPIGLDFGIKTHITASDGREWSVMVQEPDRLKRLQRKLARQVKGSKNYNKTCHLIQLEYEKMINKRNNLGYQILSELKQHELVAYQDENLNAWRRRKGFGKVIQGSVMGRVKEGLSRVPQAIMIDRFEPTTQLCPDCGKRNKQLLSKRDYSCECGYYAVNRDVHAARNMLLFATYNTPAERGGAPVEGKTVTAILREEPNQLPAKQETDNKVKTVASRGKETFSFPPEARLVSTVA